MAPKVPEKPLGALLSPLLRPQDGMDGLPPFGEEDVPVAAGETERSLVAVEGHEILQLEEVGGFLAPPPGVGLVNMVSVIAHSQEIQPTRIHGIPVGIQEGAVRRTVHRDFRMAVQISPVDGVGLPPMLHPESADSVQLFLFVGMDGRDRRILCRRRGGNQGYALFQLRRLQPGQEDLIVLLHVALGVSVIRGPREPERAVRSPGAGGHQGVAAAGAGQTYRRTPSVAPVLGEVNVPARIVGGSQPAPHFPDVGLAQVQFSDQQPGFAGGPHLQVGHLPKVSDEDRRERPLRVQPLLSVQTDDPDFPGLAKLCPLHPGQPARVLAPLDARLLPSHPDAASRVYSDRRVGLEPGGSRHRPDRHPLARRPDPQIDVVAPGGVTVPDHRQRALGSGRGDRPPIVARGGIPRADLPGRRPAVLLQAPGHDLRPVSRDGPPDQPKTSRGIPDQAVVDVGTRALGEPFRPGPAPSLKGSTVEIPIAVHLHGPDHPDPPGVVLRHRRLQHIRLRRQHLGGPPGIP